MNNGDASDVRLTPLRERTLIENARGGCAESARKLVLAHQDRLHAFVWRIVRNQQDAEEICQDAFLRAFQSLGSFDFSYRFSTWLFTIGYRLCLNTLRRRRDYTGDIDLDAIGPRRSTGESGTVADQVANSDEAIRLKKLIWESVDELTPPQRATVLLFYREMLSCQEIGEILGMPAATVKSHLHRARSRLKEVLSVQMADDWPEVRRAEGGAA
ncbi:MAG TPA: sigma-70 family RNA polymerase sigma factor [Phycisphaerae bacterium]|nr:sigma-70 family RNA polymerase sigma factor [Phycisphaerae bacterium]